MSEKVSVIIPVYNSERFLEKSIESILNQTYQNIEIIAINDGSTDNSLKILDRYSEKIIIISQQNQGLANTLNTGISQMNGKWFKWFSPDDIMNFNAIEILISEAKKLPDNTILYSNWDMIDENGKRLRDFKESNFNHFSSFEFNLRLLDGQQINVNTTLIPSILFENGCLMKNSINTNLVDYDFFLRAGLLYNANFHLIEKSLINYRIHIKQSSHKNIVNSLKQIDQLKENVLSNLDTTTRKKYQNSLTKFLKEKKMKHKTMDFGLKIMKLLPQSVSDKILVFYLNKIRSGR